MSTEDTAPAAVPDEDPREPLGRIVHEQRVALDAELAAAEGRERFRLGDWGDRTAQQRELDMRIGSAVAARAVADAKIRNENLEAQVFAIAAVAPVIRRALVIAITEAVYEAEKKPYRVVLQALGGEEET